MKKFLALYLVPPAVVETWSKTDPATRAPAEAKMRTAWGEWMRDHGSAVTGTEAGGKTKRVSQDGVADARNEIMLFAFVEAESHDAATQMFVDHPHLQIPQSAIEVMEVRPMGGG